MLRKNIEVKRFCLVVYSYLHLSRSIMPWFHLLCISPKLSLLLRLSFVIIYFLIIRVFLWLWIRINILRSLGLGLQQQTESSTSFLSFCNITSSNIYIYLMLSGSLINKNEIYLMRLLHVLVDPATKFRKYIYTHLFLKF